MAVSSLTGDSLAVRDYSRKIGALSQPFDAMNNLAA
jgi:hypothetical protein